MQKADIVRVLGELRLSILLVPAVSGLFFLTGYFDFFDIVRIKTALQAILLSAVIILSPVVLARRGWLAFREPLFLLALTFFFVELLVRRASLTALVGMAVAAFMVAIVFSFNVDLASKALKYIVLVAGIFSILAIVQFFVLAHTPDLIQHTINPNYVPVVTDLQEEDYAREYRDLHPVAYLGMTTGRKYFLGLETTRVYSFAREPGLLLLYFYLPAVLALTFNGKTRLLAIPLFALSLLGFTGAVYASLFFATVIFPFTLLRRLKVMRLLFAWVPLILIAMGTLLVYRSALIDEWFLWVFRNDFFLDYAPYLGFLDVYESGMLRLDQARELMSGIDVGEIVTGHIPGAVGLIMYAYFKASIVGALLGGLLFWQMFKTMSDFFVVTNNRLVFALLSGIYVQVGFFQQYGFNLPSGFLISAIVLQRLRHLCQSKVGLKT